MKELTRRQAMIGGGLTLVTSDPALAISNPAMLPDARLVAAIGKFNQLEQGMLDATEAADKASFAFREKLKPPPLTIRKYMSKSDGDGIYRWPSSRLVAVRVLAAHAMARPPDDPRRIVSSCLLSDTEAYERQCAAAVRPCDVERLKAEEEAAYCAMVAAIEEVIDLPFRGLAGAVLKLQLADEIGDFSEHDLPLVKDVERRSDSARLFISAMDELVRLSAEG